MLHIDAGAEVGAFRPLEGGWLSIPASQHSSIVMSSATCITLLQGLKWEFAVINTPQVSASSGPSGEGVTLASWQFVIMMPCSLATKCVTLLQGLKWVCSDQQPSSQCLCGGKVVVYTGLMAVHHYDALQSGSNMLTLLQGPKWDFAVIENPQVNAFVLPGGKAVVSLASCF